MATRPLAMDFQIPKITHEEIDADHGVFVIEPLDRGFRLRGWRPPEAGDRPLLFSSLMRSLYSPAGKHPGPLRQHWRGGNPMAPAWPR